MPSLLDTAETRLVAVLEGERGKTGLGSLAAAKYIPAGWLRRSGNRAALRDPEYPIGEYDCAYELEWLASEDLPEPSNPFDGQLLRTVRLRINVGHLYGKGSSTFVDTGASETGSTAVLNARKRAIVFAEAVYGALSVPDIWQDYSADPALVDCVREGPTVIEDLGGGRLLSATVFKLLLCLVGTTRYAP